MKRVSFNVAKALKEAGYPQIAFGHHFLYSGESAYGAVTERDFIAPTYLEIWLWLWREKKIHIEFGDMTYKIYDASEWINNYGYHLIDLSNKVVKDPEEAVIAAIEYLVNENLLK